MRRWLRLALVGGGMVALVATGILLTRSTTLAQGFFPSPSGGGQGGGASAAAATGTFTEFAVPTANSVPQSIVAGPDGNLWFTESQAGGAIGRITPAGGVTEFGITTPNSGAFWITAGPDGNLWFTESNANKIGKMSTAGAMLAEFTVPTVNSGPHGIVSGPDGNLWFSEYAGDTIGKISTAGVLTEVAHLAVGAGPTGITVGSDGSLWFTEQKANKIGKITTAGAVTEFVLGAGRTPAEIAAGADGNLWFTEYDGNRIGKMTTAGVLTEIIVPTASSQPGAIAAGIDGNLWFTEGSGNKIGRITSDGTITEFGPIPTAGSGPSGINPGPDGNLWFTERLVSKIGRLTLNCDTWLGSVDGNFGTAGNWSTGLVPTSVDDVCITATTKTGPAAKFDTYTVLLNGNFTVHSLALGGPNGTQTLVIPASGVALNLNASSSIGANGVLTMGDTGTGTSTLCCAATTLTNTGHLNAVLGGGGNHYLRLNLTNAASGTIDIGGPTSQDGVGGATATANDGTIILEKGQTLALAGASTFTQGFGGTFATTIDASAPPTLTFGGLTGGGGLVTLNGGLLKVTTIGSPWYGSAWPIISSANVNGRFASLDFGPLNYTVQYTATAVTLYGLPPCDYWIGGNGNFNTASNWSYGTVPTSADDVCINRNTTTTPKAALDTYTVVLDSNVTVNTLTLGGPSGNQTLQLAGNNTQFFLNQTSSINAGGILNVGDSNVANGYTWLGSGGGSPVLINDGRLNTVQGGGGIRYLRINLNNFTHGTMDIAAIDTRQDTSTTTTNNATFTVETGVTFAISNGGTFTNLGGSVTNNGAFRLSNSRFTQRVATESGNPVVITDGGTLDDDLSAGAGQFTLAGGSTGSDTLTGTWPNPGVPVGQVVTISSNNSTRPNQVTLATNFTNAGTITLGDTGLGHCSIENATVTLTNTGHLNTLAGGGYNRYLRVNLVNAPGGTVDIAGPTLQDAFVGTTTSTNNGTFTVETSGSLLLSPYSNSVASFVNSGGSLTNHGVFQLSNSRFTQRGGAESGNPVVITDGGTLDDDLSAGAGQFTLAGGSTGSDTLTGTGSSPGVPASQAVTISSNNATRPNQVTLATNFTNAGTITLGDTGLGHCSIENATLTLTNTGHLNTIAGGGYNRYLRVNLVNAAAGTVDIAGPTLQDAFVGTTTSTNNGTFTVEPSGSLLLSPYSNYIASFVNSAGSVTNNGTFRLSNSRFTQRAGTESGSPVVITDGGTLDDDLSSGAGQFTLAGGSTGYDALTGTGTGPGIPSGQVVTISSNNATRPNQVMLATNFTNAGTLTLGDTGTGHCSIENATVTLTNTGHLNTIAGGGYNRYLRVNLVNAAAGTVDIGGPTLQDVSVLSTINNGNFIIESGTTFSLSAGATFTQSAGGTFQTTIDANATKFGQLNGGGDAVNLDGKLTVMTVGHPAAGSSWPIISNAIRSGQFATCGLDYDVEYPASGVTLVVGVPPLTAVTTTQYNLPNSNGTTWQDMDAAHLIASITPNFDSYAILSGNSDLWTSTAGFNQDIGISVSGGGTTPGSGVYPSVAGQPEAWKESGGFAGTFSPNAAFVQAVVFLKQGQTYTVKLVWKANQNAPGATIWAGAGPIGGQYSPTRLAAQLLPASTANSKSAAITSQASQSGSDGVTWKDIDPNLSLQYTPCANGLLMLSGNADLWTSVAGYNQDLGIAVSGGAYPKTAGQPEAWKESGGFAGTFSPNAAFVHGVIPVAAGTQYSIRLQWKANTPSPSTATIWAGAGPIGSQYSPTRLALQFVPAGSAVSRVLEAVSTQQYTLKGNDGAAWADMDTTSATPLTLQFTSSTTCVAVLGANSDLWTDTAGYNQDIAINVNGAIQAWKESGGFAGTYSPNAAYVHAVVIALAPGSYTVKLQWKANKASASTAAIWAGAGPIGARYSPTRLTVQLFGCT